MLTTRTADLRSAEILPPHEVRDPSKFAAIVASMEIGGWIGRPILAIDDGQIQALTGSHRIAAARRAGIQIPVVLIETDDYDADELSIGRPYGDSILGASDDDMRLYVLQSIPGLETAAQLMAAEIAANEEDS